MSRSLNKVTLIGNLGADPEVRSTQNGGRVATLSVATSRQWKGQDGQMQEKTEWHRVIFWNSNYAKLADIAEKYCRKGEKVFVEGSIEYRSWQDKEGQTRYTTEIRGNELILLGGRGGQGAESFAPPRPVPPLRPVPPRARRSHLTTSPTRWTARTTTFHSEAGRPDAMHDSAPAAPTGGVAGAIALIQVVDSQQVVAETVGCNPWR